MDIDFKLKEPCKDMDHFYNSLLFQFELATSNLDIALHVVTFNTSVNRVKRVGSDLRGVNRARNGRPQQTKPLKARHKHSQPRLAWLATRANETGRMAWRRLGIATSLSAFESKSIPLEGQCRSLRTHDD